MAAHHFPLQNSMQFWLSFLNFVFPEAKDQIVFLEQSYLILWMMYLIQLIILCSMMLLRLESKGNVVIINITIQVGARCSYGKEVVFD